MSVASEEAYFQILDSFLHMLGRWKETIMMAARVFNVPENQVRKALAKIEEWEEEALHYQIFGF